jgi:ABC-type glycerol-3-phosphate transport system substrate-binding protein
VVWREQAIPPVHKSKKKEDVMKKQLSRRHFLKLGGAVAGATVLASCAPATASPTAQGGAATKPAVPPATAIPPTEVQPVPLSFWNMPFVTQEVSAKYVTQWQDAVAKALPNVKVDPFYGPGDYVTLRQKYLLQAKSGTPDVIEGLLEDLAVYVKQGLVEPLDDKFGAWADSSQFVQASITPLTINGKLYALPYNTNARGLIYRKDLLAQYGLAVPETWQDMVTSARTITQKTNKQVFGFFVCTLVGDPRAPQEFISWYFQVSGGKDMFDVSSGTPTLVATTDQLEQVLTLYDDLFTGDWPACDPNQRGTGWPVEDPGYAAGKWAMAPMGTWLWGRRSESDTAKDILENKSVVTQLPIPPGGAHKTYFEVKPIGLNSFSKYKDEAWELMKFICSKDQMGMWLADSGGVPARKDSLTIDAFTKSEIGPWIKMFADFLDTGVALSPINWGPVNEANMKAVNYVVYAQKSPKDAAVWLVDQIHDMEKNKTL